MQPTIAVIYLDVIKILKRRYLRLAPRNRSLPGVNNRSSCLSPSFHLSVQLRLIRGSGYRNFATTVRSLDSTTEQLGAPARQGHFASQISRASYRQMQQLSLRLLLRQMHRIIARLFSIFLIVLAVLRSAAEPLGQLIFDKAAVKLLGTF